MAFLRFRRARGPGARDRGADRPSRAGRCARGRGIGGRVVPVAEQLTALRRRGLPPGRLAIPLFTPFLEDGFYRRQWNRYGPIYTTNMLYKPTVAVGGIELGRRILREHRDELRPPAFSDGDRVEGGCVRNQVGERHRASRAVFHVRIRPEHGGGRPSGDGSCGQASPCDLVGGKRRFRPAGITDSLPPGAAGT